MDEMRVGQKGRVGHCWWERGQRPPGLRDARTEWAYVHGAVRPADGHSHALVLPEVNTTHTNRFLAHVGAQLAPDEHAVMIMDKAGYHRSGNLQVPDNITPLKLPSYSPELNPVERVWLYMRERFLSHRVFVNYHAILDACCAAWNAVANAPDLMHSLTNYPYLRKVRT